MSDELIKPDSELKDNQTDETDEQYTLPTVSLGPHFELHPIVFPVAAVILLAIVAFAAAVASIDDFLMLFTDSPVASASPTAFMEQQITKVRTSIGSNFGWLYVISMTGFMVFGLWLALSRFGRVKLGKDDEKPEFNTWAWFAMLFSAGMGIGLVFWSVAEPIYHLRYTPPGFTEGLQPSRFAMAVTIFHWGLHPWALYAVVALALAYFGFRRDMPLSFRSLLHPIFGDLVWGRLGDCIDVLTIVATLVGVATSLGFGAQQVNAGLSFLFGMPITTTWQIILIAGITAIATVSVVLGLDVGIRRLSEANMILAAALMLLIILGGGVVAFFASTVENTGAYLQMLPFSSFRTGAFNEDGRTWLNGWTVFYWAWWIAWSPFVGMFIARVSRGRTIREFITGVLLVPTGVCIIWLTAFGTATLREHDELTTKIDHATEYVDATKAAQIEKDIRTEELPVYPVQAQSKNGMFAVGEDGELVGGHGHIYRQTDDNHFVALADPNQQQTQDIPLTLVTKRDGTKFLQTKDGQPFDPLAIQGLMEFDGSYQFKDKHLTTYEYFYAPVLNENHHKVLPGKSTALFALIDSLFAKNWLNHYLPSGWLISIAAGAATLCIILFFVTSSDSASMVIDIIASGGNPDPPLGTRLFWAITEGLVAAGLLVAGGLGALQTASITAALPFTLILILACIALVKALFTYEKQVAKKPGL